MSSEGFGYHGRQSKRESICYQVDLGQDAEGLVTVDGKERHLTLAINTQRVGSAVKKFAQKLKRSIPNLAHCLRLERRRS